MALPMYTANVYRQTCRLAKDFLPRVQFWGFAGSSVVYQSTRMVPSDVLCGIIGCDGSFASAEAEKAASRSARVCDCSNAALVPTLSISLLVVVRFSRSLPVSACSSPDREVSIRSRVCRSRPPCAGSGSAGSTPAFSASMGSSVLRPADVDEGDVMDAFCALPATSGSA